MFGILLILFVYAFVAGATFASFTFVVTWVKPTADKYDAEMACVFCAIFWPFGLPMLLAWATMKIALRKLGLEKQ